MNLILVTVMKLSQMLMPTNNFYECLAKLDKQEINEDEFKALEEALAEDMEEMILEEIEGYQTTL